MGLLGTYEGVFVNARSATNDIDIESIINGCNAVDADASNIINFSNKIYSLGEMITSEDLSVDGMTIVNNLNECCNNINSVYNTIVENTTHIKELAETIYNNFQEQYNYEAQYNDRIAQIENSK